MPTYAAQSPSVNRLQRSFARIGEFGLGLFIRSLVGLDREAAAQAFSEFLTGTQATSAQIEFIQLIIEELTRNGVMEAERLFQSPYTDLNAQGPLAIFPADKVTRICDVLSQIRERAAA